MNNHSQYIYIPRITSTSHSTNSSGFLTRCAYCGCLIYLKLDCDSRWRPYESWFAGTVEEGEWKLHKCDHD